MGFAVGDRRGAVDGNKGGRAWRTGRRHGHREFFDATALRPRDKRRALRKGTVPFSTEAKRYSFAAP
jgi:hypothetical protein